MDVHIIILRVSVHLHTQISKAYDLTVSPTKKPTMGLLRINR